MGEFKLHVLNPISVEYWEGGGVNFNAKPILWASASMSMPGWARVGCRVYGLGRVRRVVRVCLLVLNFIRLNRIRASLMQAQGS